LTIVGLATGKTIFLEIHFPVIGSGHPEPLGHFETPPGHISPGHGEPY
jgi:hypothetical protein